MGNHRLFSANLSRLLSQVFLLLLLSEPVSAELRPSEAYARATLPGAMNSAAYMTLSNEAEADRVLVGVESARIGRVSIHEQVLEDGMASMRELDSLLIPAKGSIELKPGGLHLMLMGLKSPLLAGEKLTLVLNFEDRRSQRVELPVRSVLDLRH